MSTNLTATIKSVNAVSTRGYQQDNVHIAFYVRVVDTKGNATVWNYDQQYEKPFRPEKEVAANIPILFKADPGDLITITYGFYNDPAKSLQSGPGTNSIFGTVIGGLAQIVGDAASAYLLVAESETAINWHSIGADIASKLGTAIVPLASTALTALSGWVSSQLPAHSPTTAAAFDDDGSQGLVALRAHTFTFANLPQGTQVDYHPGIAAPANIGSDSKYLVAWSVAELPGKA
jgi:hypothetical protein